MSMLQKVTEIFSPSVKIDYVAELAATKYTSDVWKIEQYSHQLVFVFDHHKKDHPLNAILGPEAKLRWPGYTMKKFHLWESPAPWDNQFIPTPVVVDIPRFPPAAAIRGEIWKIPSLQLLRLDMEYQNTVEFQRQRTSLVVPTRKVVFVKDPSLDPDFGVMETIHRRDYTGSSVKHSPEKVAIVKAWMYIGKPEFWNPLISAYDGYKPVEHFESKQRRWLPKYYYIRRPVNLT
jgi:hypothetical protein